ncbi:MAG TPA: cytochrome c oxidase assembly protein [Gemmatimonadales bacterium]|nr:cytochrome c oxidase assembly protein [Gemmatimonadales bacterium]
MAPTGVLRAVLTPVAPSAVWRAWEWDPSILTGLALLGAVYVAGNLIRRREHRRADRTRGRESACFAAGWLLLVVALVSPLHPLGEQIFVAHMIQHELLMVAAAPLLILGRPERRLLWLLPVETRRALTRLSRGGIGTGWRMLSQPIVALSIYLVILLGWHLPGPYDAALRSEPIHALEHLAFLGSALIFWWVVFGAVGRSGRSGSAVLLLFGAAVCSSGLGALLTMSEQPWYSVYLGRTAIWGFSPLQDQQLGGLIMWVPACLTYLAAALAITASWLALAGRRANAAGRPVRSLPEPR